MCGWTGTVSYLLRRERQTMFVLVGLVSRVTKSKEKEKVIPGVDSGFGVESGWLAGWLALGFEFGFR
jgi:hypothetical protein